jgi:hypothetical protein
MLDLEQKQSIVIYNCCLHQYLHSQGKIDKNNSNIHKHVNKHNAEKEAARNRRNQATADNTQDIQSYYLITSMTNKSPEIMKQNLDELLLKTAIICNWSFDQFDNIQFCSFISRAFSGHICSRRKRITALLKKKTIHVREAMKTTFSENDSRISLALDCWTSLNR